MSTTATADPGSVQFRTRRDYTIAAVALTHRAIDLEKLAEKNEKEGYHREARTQRSDASAITEIILPAFREQGEFPLVTTDQLRKGIVDALRDVVRGMLVVRAPEDKQEDALISREDRLLESLAIRIESYATEIAAEAFAAGYAARENDPEVLANRALSALASGSL